MSHEGAVGGFEAATQGSFAKDELETYLCHHEIDLLQVKPENLSLIYQTFRVAQLLLLLSCLSLSLFVCLFVCTVIHLFNHPSNPSTRRLMCLSLLSFLFLLLLRLLSFHV